MVYLPMTTDQPLAVRYALTFGGAGCAPATNAVVKRLLAEPFPAYLARVRGGAGTSSGRSTPRRRSAGLQWCHLPCLL